MGIYSFSQIRTVYECPYKYKSIYIDKIKVPSNIYALFGQAIHKVFKDIVVDNLDRKKSLFLWKKYFEYEISNNSDIITIKNYKFWEKRGYPVIQKFITSKKELDIISVIKAEKRDRSKYKNNDFYYVIDLIYKNSDNELIFLDYKTGKPKVIDYYQLVFYSKLSDIKFNKMCLYYTWQNPIFFNPEKYWFETEKYIDEGVEIIKRGIFNKNKNKNEFCKKCYLLKNNICKN